MVGDIAGEDIARKKRTEEKILQRIRFEWQRDGDIYIHREYEYLNSGFFFYYSKGVHFPLEFFI